MMDLELPDVEAAIQPSQWASEVTTREEDHLRTADISNIHHIGVGSSNTVYIGKTDHGKVIIKSVHDKHEIAQEVGAHVVNQELGGLVDAPPVVERDLPTYGHVTVQGFREGETPDQLGSVFGHRDGGHDQWRPVGRVPNREIKNMALFDQIVHNTDRHGGNLMVSPDRMHVSAIDNSLAFKQRQKFNAESLREVHRRGHEVPCRHCNGEGCWKCGYAGTDAGHLGPGHMQLLREFQGKRDHITKRLTDVGLAKDQIDAMWLRVNDMIEGETLHHRYNGGTTNIHRAPGDRFGVIRPGGGGDAGAGYNSEFPTPTGVDVTEPEPGSARNSPSGAWCDECKQFHKF